MSYALKFYSNETDIFNKTLKSNHRYFVDYWHFFIHKNCSQHLLFVGFLALYCKYDLVCTYAYSYLATLGTHQSRINKMEGYEAKQNNVFYRCCFCFNDVKHHCFHLRSELHISPRSSHSFAHLLEGNDYPYDSKNETFCSPFQVMKLAGKYKVAECGNYDKFSKQQNVFITLFSYDASIRFFHFVWLFSVSCNIERKSYPFLSI